MYEWGFNDQALDDLDGLEVSAQAALLELLNAVVFDPWEYGRPPGQEVDRTRGLRSLPFGAAGMVWFVILDRDRQIVIVRVQWAG